MPWTGRPRRLSGNAIRPVPMPSSKGRTSPCEIAEEIHRRIDDCRFEQLRPLGLIASRYPFVEVVLWHMAHYRSRPFQATNEYGDARLGSDWQAKRRMARREGAAGHFVSSRLRTRSRTARVGPNEDNSCLHPAALSVGLTKVPNMVWGHALRGLIQMCSALAKYKCMPTDNPKVPTLVILGTFETSIQPDVNGLTSVSSGTLRRHPRRWMVHVD
jgi:hypothetical protein